MVFYTFVIAMKPRPRKQTTQALREIAAHVYNNGGMIRKFTNEGIMRPYNRFRDADNTLLTYTRYLTMQLDMSEENMSKVQKLIKEHADVHITLLLSNLERPFGASRNLHNNAPYFPLDTFVRLEEEINWPPQVSGDVYEQLDMNWKEFSRTRWSNFLRK